ncbi:hypothetical protein PybrP1_012233 [[Pythium] brassicae (nom. inval.)]|nr:hypothetical protein PybrP1_012233 [[Pythium] brassicae (nom. inval.)]
MQNRGDARGRGDDVSKGAHTAISTRRWGTHDGGCIYPVKRCDLLTRGCLVCVSGRSLGRELAPDPRPEPRLLPDGKLNELTSTRVKASVCRVLLATVPVHSRFVIRMLYDEEMLERMCEYAADTDPALRCYATGLLAVGLRDRSVADIVVNKETPMKLLRRARLFASKLDRERQLAVKYMQEHIRNSSVRQKRNLGGNNGPGKANTLPLSSAQKAVLGVKRKHSEGNLPAAECAGPDGRASVDTSNSAEVEEVKESDDTEPSGSLLPSVTVDDPDIGDDISGGNIYEDGVGRQGSAAPDSTRHEEDLKRLVLLELLHTLDCIGSMGEYLELFGPAHKEDIIGTIITFLHSKNPMVLSHTMKLTSHFLAHKKFSFSFIEAGGVELIFEATKFQQASGQIGLLDRSLSMCLHGFASSSIVIEKILALDPESLLSVAFGLLSSPNDRARQNAVVFFGLTLPFKAILDYFEKQNGLYTLLNIIRAGNNPKSAAQRQLSHDACLCLRQYLRVHLALVVHRLRRKLAQVNHPSNRASIAAATTTIPTAATAASRLPARVPKLSWLKPIDVDDKAHEQNLIFYEKFRFSVAGANAGSAWSAASAPGGGMWAPAAKLLHLRGILVMLEVTAMMCSHIQHADTEESSSSSRMWSVERAQFCLESLRVLTLVVPGLASEVCSTEAAVTEEMSAPKRPGITLLLELALSTNARDSDLVRDALRILCNCVSPPHGEECWQHPYKDIRQYTLTARSMRTRNEQDGSGSSLADGTPAFDTGDGAAESSVNCCARSKDDKMLRPVRKLARERNAIKVCVQLLRYKRSVQNADAIRLLATRALLGLSRDKQIAQILEKMQIGQLLSDLIRNEPILEENADLHVRFRESALDLISQVTHRAPNAVINEATDPTVRKIEKASIVAQTKISYDDNELLRLIHDHLVTKGLASAASALSEEAGLSDQVAEKAISLTPSRLDSAAVVGKQSPRASKTRAVDITSFSSALKSVAGSFADDTRRPAKIARTGNSVAEPDLSTRKLAETRSQSLSVSTVPRTSKLPLNVVAAAVSTTPGLRRKRVMKALASPSFFGPEVSKQSASSPRWSSDSGLPTSAHKARPSSHGVSLQLGLQHKQASKLDEIITHYLREQHRQCSNPVATIPPFKLLGKNAVHHCPDLPTTSTSSLSICARLTNRDRVGSRFGTRSFASPYADAGVNRYVFSRYRPYRTLGGHDTDDWGGVSVTRFFGKDQRDVLMGSHEGELRLVNIDSDSVVEQWSCHSESSAIVDLETNEHTRIGSQSRLILTGSTALSVFGTTEIALWDVNDMTSPRWRFEAAISPQFSHYGDRIVALDGRDIEREDQVDDSREVRGAVMIDIATGEALCELMDPMRSNEYGLETNCSFSPCDGTILTDGMLWDARLPTRALYKFDKLSNVGYGFFHPGGNEVIINSAVWDLRTYKLLRMVPALDKCSVKFNSSGSILYAYYPFAGVHAVFPAHGCHCAHQGHDLDRRRGKLKTWFRVLDARDYKDISTIELERPIFDLSIDAKSSLLSVVEGRYADADEQDETICRLYDIGRKKPSEDDSDVEDAHDDSDTLDDDEFDEESESGEGEESDEDEDDDEDDDDEDLGSEFMDSGAEGGESGEEEDDDMDGDQSDASGMSNREIRFLLELPEEEYYGVRGQYSSDEEEDEDDET